MVKADSQSWANNKQADPGAEASPSGILRLFTRMRVGEQGAREELIRVAYQSLHRVATRLMGRERPDPTLQPTALLNEALAQLLDQKILDTAPTPAYFFGAVAKTMRRLLIDHERLRAAEKHGGHYQPLPLEQALCFPARSPEGILADLHEALEELAQGHGRASSVVTLHFLAGFTFAEVAEQLQVSLSTVESDWRFARAWLRRHLADEATRRP